ncbi:hypothetical protein [Jannaschia pohangensis]|uniref:Penicillin-insensitive murein endopeptidase n=1 Tax=Jannaschia pohangensis TaxID=390807 RepID=A0A1I3QGX1_9RHOB|nr:hypothetical protein [Jannaschia pohangensis]SFJ32752.1 hypothetical protein SAMN04488095_2522 [Jannaschia pohangensis]
MRTALQILLHGAAILFLTLLSQLGGLAWVLALPFRRRRVVFFAGFAAIYAALSVTAAWVAPTFGRVPMACGAEGPLRIASPVYCLLNRHYGTPELAAVLNDLSRDMTRRHPDATVQLLDANFPFFDGFPLLPHLSHADGRKADVALFYLDPDGAPGPALRSPLGYFAFEDGPTDCPPRRLTLRWDLAWLQPLWRDLSLDRVRTRDLLALLAADERVGRIFVEPHLRATLDIDRPTFGFQGCRAARHDDHIHLQLK